MPKASGAGQGDLEQRNPRFSGISAAETGREEKHEKIAYLAPDAARLEHIKGLLAAHESEILFATGSLDKGIKAAEALMNKGVDIIIARGETAYNIRDSFPDVIVVAVPVSGFDLAMALEESRRHGTTVAVIAFPSMIRRIEQLETPLGVKIIKCELPPRPSEKAVNQKIDEALAAGAEVLLGGFTTREAARKRALPYVEFPTGDEAYIESFHHARTLLKSLEQERSRTGFIKGILDAAYEGIVYADKSGEIILMNPVARDILKHSPAKTKKSLIGSVCSELNLESVLRSGKAERDKIYQVKGVQILCSKVPIMERGRVTGAVASFQETCRIQTMENRIRKEIYAKGHVARYSFGMILDGEKRTRELLLQAKSIAQADANVVILGETGTGKEVFAQSIHQASTRKNGPFVAVNCAAIPAALLESELFGYVEGAFTGAKKQGKQGFFEIAHQGTLFLDEIAEMDISLQSKLLRVLQEGAVMRLGSDRLIPVDARVIAATHNDLQRLVQAGSFRMDLYYRLNILTLRLPPLRERRKDISRYAKHFIVQCAGKAGKRMTLSPGALRYLESLDWPGNIRELRNMMERIAVMAKRESISASYLQSLLQESAPCCGDLGPRCAREKEALQKKLELCEGDLGAVAQALGISRVTLWRRLSRYSLDWRQWR